MAAKRAREQIGQNGNLPRQGESRARIGASNGDLCREWENPRASQMFCDVELRGCEAESPRLPCHRSVLSVRSAYFRTMFLSGMKESTQKVIQLHNMSHTVLSQLNGYCYMEDVIVTESNMQSLLIAAAFLDIGTVVDACWEFMEKHIHAKNCLMLYCLADSDAHKNPALADKAKVYVLKHFADVSQGPEFLELPKTTVIDLIRYDTLQHDFEQRRWEFWEMLQRIRLAYLSPQCRDEYLLACINASMDYSGAEKALSHLKVLPGTISEASSTLYTARKSYEVDCKGVIVCAGGFKTWTVLLDSVEYFSPNTAQWTKLAPLPYKVANAGLAVINGDLFLCGGILGFRIGDVTPWALRYDSARAVWKHVAPMHTGRRDLGIASMGDHIYVVGGFDDHYQAVATVERYDALSNQWAYVASLPKPLAKSVVISFDSQIFAFGGDYRPSTMDRLTREHRGPPPSEESHFLHKGSKHM
ncbi:kelch-like protein 4 [Paramacrobiotus metropolitanus]|uniref:kelch-like protein 4 n=1 Tax=Paramacrobiotus metropolitanus TaxID=2943436 RepID=UPI002445D694|nr:kelch-like protein 4 [Paramacrobiotus metropolitanus]